jgi:hypothetical protein
MIPAKLALEKFTEGDEWDGIPSLTITINGAAPPVPLASAKMRFKKPGAVPSTVVELSSATPGQITIVSAATWEISVPPQLVAGLTFGKWTWRLRCLDTSTTGRPKTYLADEIEVLETI